MNTNQASATSAIVAPTYEELKKEFDWVSDGFKKGEAKYWRLHESCQNIPAASLESLKLIHFGKVMTDKTALEALKARDLRPANLEELLIYARANPDKQKEFPIVALGSSCLWTGGRGSPCLSWDNGGRDLDLGWSGRVRGDRCRVLAVRA